jgi:N-acetylglucosaminyldiphosphoundecaprenol N-acetyl-beta-D-mannosaminyltransferase
MDGIQTVIFGRMYRLGQFERISFDFSSLAGEVFSYYNNKKGRVVFIGSKTEDLAGFLKIVKERYPGLSIVYERDGYFDTNVEPKIRREVLLTEPDLVVIGMGTKRQDSLALDLWRESNKKLQIFTCGGFFHQTAMSDGEYFPLLVDKFNLRFLYRIFREKGTLFKLVPDIFFPIFYMYKLYSKK